MEMNGSVVTCQHAGIDGLHPNKNPLSIGVFISGDTRRVYSEQRGEQGACSWTAVARCLYTTQHWAISTVELAPAERAKTQINEIGLPGLRSHRHFVN